LNDRDTQLLSYEHHGDISYDKSGNSFVRHTSIKVRNTLASHVLDSDAETR
jgi:hypothetical protein